MTRRNIVLALCLISLGTPILASCSSKNEEKLEVISNDQSTKKENTQDKQIIEVKSASSYFRDGKKKFDSEDYEAAIIDFSKAILVDSQYLEAYIYRSESRYYLEDYEGALRDADTAIEIDPEDVDAYVARADAIYFLED